jgi:methylated-DNA-[protein]-cysteine S-methyltransferase
VKEIFWSGSEETEAGVVWAAVCDQGLVAVQIGGNADGFRQILDNRYEGTMRFSEAHTGVVMEQIEAYLRGERKNFTLKIHWEVMSAFQQKVLQVVHTIPYGETRSYGEIAAQIGMPQAPRAVGRANATNPIPLVIPCHRVIGKDGNLRGYGSGKGVETKAWLLSLEGANINH